MTITILLSMDSIHNQMMMMCHYSKVGSKIGRQGKFLISCGGREQGPHIIPQKVPVIPGYCSHFTHAPLEAIQSEPKLNEGNMMFRRWTIRYCQKLYKALFYTDLVLVRHLFLSLW